jgi:hypothetical protein
LQFFCFSKSFSLPIFSFLPFLLPFQFAVIICTFFFLKLSSQLCIVYFPSPSPESSILQFDLVAFLWTCHLQFPYSISTTKLTLLLPVSPVFLWATTPFLHRRKFCSFAWESRLHGYLVWRAELFF